MRAIAAGFGVALMGVKTCSILYSSGELLLMFGTAAAYILAVYSVYEARSVKEL